MPFREKSSQLILCRQALSVWSSSRVVVVLSIKCEYVDALGELNISACPRFYFCSPPRCVKLKSYPADYSLLFLFIGVVSIPWILRGWLGVVALFSGVCLPLFLGELRVRIKMQGYKRPRLESFLGLVPVVGLFWCYSKKEGIFPTIYLQWDKKKYKAAQEKNIESGGTCNA